MKPASFFSPGRRKPVLAPLLLLLIIIGMQAVPAASGDRFLIPLIKMDGIEFNPGEKAGYLLISEAYGVCDSTLVTFKVLSSCNSDTGIEIESAPVGSDSSEIITIRLSLPGTGGAAWTADSTGLDYESILIRAGNEPFRGLTDEEIEEFDINDFIFDPSGYSRDTLPDTAMMTPAGEFSCRVVEFRKSTRDEVKLGGTAAFRMEEVSAVLWRSSGVPFWGLVRSEVIRKRSTEIDSPSIPRGMLDSGEKIYRAFLISL